MPDMPDMPDNPTSRPVEDLGPEVVRLFCGQSSHNGAFSGAVPISGRALGCCPGDSRSRLPPYDQCEEGIDSG